MQNERVSLVIPGRDCAGTIRQCLSAAVPLLDDPQSRLAEIVFVNDGSTDDTAEIVREFPVKVVTTAGAGRSVARNLGWRAATHALIWFVDSDCVVEPDALRLLLPHLDDPQVGGVSGSYGNMNPDSLLACLVHEEIIERHRRMTTRVDFLATFNVLYRRAVLEEVAGFDERFLRGEDAELSFRVSQAGYELHFELASRVKHYHRTRWSRYLKAQQQEGYWRVWLHTAFPGHTRGDSYSSLLDHIQPPLAMLSLPALLLALVPNWRWTALVPLALLALAQLPLTWCLLTRLKQARYLAFAVMSFVRAYWRGFGMMQGLLGYLSGASRKTPAAGGTRGST